MKKAVLFFGVMFFLGTAKAQNVIPFNNPFFSYPVLVNMGNYLNHDTVFLPQDTINNLIECIQHGGITYGMIAQMHFSPSSVNILGIATTSSDTHDLPSDISFLLIKYSNDSTKYLILDSINSNTLCYSKRMLFDYGTTSCFYDSVPIPTPCNLYFFNKKIQVQDTFYLGEINRNTSRPYMLIRPVLHSSPFYTYGTICLVKVDENNPLLAGSFIWGGLYFILDLPCPKPAKPQVGPNYAGDVTLRWTPGDTTLYQLAFHTYQDDTPVYTTDTLTDTVFHLVDSLVPAAMADGRYTVRIRKACNYMDSPYHTIVWSDWSEPMQFLYMHRREGLVGPGTEILPFSLTPNPTAGDATLTFDTPLPADATLEVYGPDGRLLDSFTLPAGTASHRLATASYSSGLYLLHLVTPSAAGTQKLSIQH